MFTKRSEPKLADKDISTYSIELDDKTLMPYYTFLLKNEAERYRRLLQSWVGDSQIIETYIPKESSYEEGYIEDCYYSSEIPKYYEVLKYSIIKKEKLCTSE